MDRQLLNDALKILVAAIRQGCQTSAVTRLEVVIIKIVVVSALFAALPALFGGMVAFDIPTIRPLLESRVCGAEGTLGLRITTTNLHRTTMRYHCHYPDGRTSESLTMATLSQGFFLVWPPLTLSIALVWWLIAAFKRPGREEQDVSQTSEDVTYVVGREHAARIEQLVNSKKPSLREVGELLTSLHQSGILQKKPLDSTIGVDEVQDTAATLRSLQALLDGSLITQEEYDHKRAEVLARYFGDHI